MEFQALQTSFRSVAGNIRFVVPSLARHRRYDLCSPQAPGRWGNLKVENRVIHRLRRSPECVEKNGRSPAVDKIGGRAGHPSFQTSKIASGWRRAAYLAQEPLFPLPCSRRISNEPSGHQSVDWRRDGVSLASSASSSRMSAAGKSDSIRRVKASLCPIMQAAEPGLIDSRGELPFSRASLSRSISSTASTPGMRVASNPSRSRSAVMASQRSGRRSRLMT